MSCIFEWANIREAYNTGPCKLQAMFCAPRKKFNVSRLDQRWRIQRTILFLFVIILLAGCDSNTLPSSPLPSSPLGLSSDLKRGPYVQLGGTESILVVWETISNTQGAVEFGLTDSLGTRIASSELGTRHSLSLTGLQSSTYYYYRVLDGGRPLSQITRFHTNQQSNLTNFSFLVVGDSGFGSVEMFKVADLINASAASFGLHTGDVIYFYGEEHLYDSYFFYPYARFLATNVMYMSIGNHDLVTDSGAPFLNNFYLPANNLDGTELYYSFDYGQAHFVALATNLSTAPGSAQRTWLERDMATTTKPWKFVFFHNPPYTAGFIIIDGTRVDLADLSVRRNLAPLFELFGVDIVFSGHSHSYERTFPILQNHPVDEEQDPYYVNPSGPIYVTTGGGGAPLLGLDSSSLNARAVSAYHIVEVSLSDDELIGRAIEPGVGVIDEFRVVHQETR
ncbi:MAG: metallophosphoesterase family protein [Bacteroidetes bacterium]|nr:metallophosphoesterase family protein [Bacteroidota bacterium]